MKKLFYLTSVTLLFLCLFLGVSQPVFGQTNTSQAVAKDSMTIQVVQSNSIVNPLAISVATNHPGFSKPIGTMQAQSVLTGPGKVVVCVVVLSCLFFYFNRKK